MKNAFKQIFVKVCSRFILKKSFYFVFKLWCQISAFKFVLLSCRQYVTVRKQWVVSSQVLALIVLCQCDKLRQIPVFVSNTVVLFVV